MPLIDVTTLLGIADRAAAQYHYIKDAVEQLIIEGTGYYFDRVSSTDDPDVEIPTVTSYEIVDEDFQMTRLVVRGTQLPLIIGAMEAHFNRRDGTGHPLQPGGWDGYLTTKNKRVSQYFAELFKDTKSYYMLANNVFSEGEDVFATIEIKAGPSIDFTDGINYGNGASTNPANGTYFAPTQLKVVVVSMAASNLDLRLHVKDPNNLPTTINVTIPAGSPPGAEIPVGSASNRFLDVFGASFIPFSSYGTLGDKVRIENKKERQIAL
jgi:hypothetical protein